MDGSGGNVQLLRTLNVVEAPIVAERGTTLVPDVDFEWSADGSLRKSWGRWTDRYRGLAVTLTHGFTPEEAADVKAIVLQVVAMALSSPLGATREQAGALAVSWATTAPGVSGGLTLLERDLALLSAYRLAEDV